jgi:hypothetical protein
MSSNEIVIKPVPSNALEVDSYIVATCRELIKFDLKHLKLIYEFANFIYASVDRAQKQYGMVVGDVFKAIEYTMKDMGHPVHTATMRKHYVTMRFMQDIKYEDKVLFDRIDRVMSAGIMRYSKLGEIANSGMDFHDKMKLLKEIIVEDKKINFDELKYIVSQKKNLNGCPYGNVFNTNFLLSAFIEKYMVEGQKCFVPFPTNEEHLVKNIESTTAEERTFLKQTLQFDRNNEEYDDLFLMMAQFSFSDLRDPFGIRVADDFMALMDKLIAEAFRVTKLNGLVAVVGWNKPIFLEPKRDYCTDIYKLMEQHGDWYETIVVPFSLQLQKRMPDYAYRVIHIFRKR